jgi:hypothetical protein
MGATMAGTRTAGTIDGSGSYKHISVSFQDVSGDPRTISDDVPIGVTDAQVESLVAALQAASQASIFRVGVEMVYAGDEDASNAESGTRDSVYDNVAIRLKNPTANLGKTQYIPAPDPAVMLADSDQVDPASTELGAVFTAWLALLSGYSVKSARFTERREINQATKF